MSSTTVLALNSNEDGLERMKLNASKNLLVDGSAVTQPVSIAATVTVDASGTTVPVSGAFYQATQPISAAVALTVDGSGVTQPVSGAFYPATQPVTGAFYQATQPISAAVALTVDGSGVTQPISGSVSITGNVATTGGALSVANNSVWTSQTIAAAATAVTTGLDISLYRSVVIYGDTDNTSDEIKIEISFDNTNYYDLGDNLYPDGSTGNFVKQLSTDAKYIRLSKTNNLAVAETITADIMVKSG
tara:strand:+ start:13054 stop:13791 length:738 start_codon:yes stop_codon:yes gene_type:complete